MVIRLYPFPFTQFVAKLLLIALIGILGGGAIAQDRTYLDGFDPGRSVRFEAATAPGMNKVISPDGKLRAESEFQKVRIWSAESNELLHEFGTEGHCYSPTFTPDGEQVVVAVCRGNLGCISTLYSWDLKTAKRTRLGECSGVVLDMSFDAQGNRLAVVTAYGQLGSFGVYSTHRKWYGGEIVVINLETQDKPIQIFCELSGILEPSKDGVKDEETMVNFKKSLSDAYRRSLPVRVGLTEDGTKVVGVTSTGVVRVFDAESGMPELEMNSKGRVGSEIFFD